MNKILALAKITLIEGIRNRSLMGIAFLALFMFGLNISVAGFFMRDVGKVTVDMNMSALSFSGILLVLFIVVNLMAKDIDRKTIHLVFSKQISRTQYIFGKYVGIQFIIFTSLLVLFVFSAATVALVKFLFPDYFIGFSWAIFIIAAFFTLIKFSVLSAIVVFFSTITSNSFITLIFSTCSYVVGVTIEEVLFYVNSEFAKDEKLISEPLRLLIRFISYIFPNFSVFDFSVEAAHGLPVAPEIIVTSFGYAMVYICLLLVFSAVIFNRREFN